MGDTLLPQLLKKGQVTDPMANIGQSGYGIQMPQNPIMEGVKKVGDYFTPDYLKNPNQHLTADEMMMPNAVGKLPTSQQDNPLPWMAIDAASMVPGAAVKGASSLAAKLAALKLAPLLKLKDWEGKLSGTLFDILKSESPGSPVGRVSIQDVANPKDLEVNYIHSFGGKGYMGGAPNSFGPKEIRTLVKELKRVYPEAETVGGLRTSGARVGPASKSSTNLNTKVRLK